MNNQYCDGSLIDHRGVVVAGPELQSRLKNARSKGILYHTWKRQAAIWREQAIKGGFVELVNQMDDAFNVPCLPAVIRSSRKGIENVERVEQVEQVERADDNVICQQLHTLAKGTV